MDKQPIILVAAMSKSRVIGYQNQLPWHLPADLKFFKEITTGKTVIMGRKTFDSIGRRPLPNRQNIVITKDIHCQSVPGCKFANSLEEALAIARQNPYDIMIIGGQTIYEQTLSMATDLYLTVIDVDVEGDTFFPEWKGEEWKEIERVEHKADKENPYDFYFLKFKRISEVSSN